MSVPHSDYLQVLAIRALAETRDQEIRVQERRNRRPPLDGQRRDRPERGVRATLGLANGG